MKFIFVGMPPQTQKENGCRKVTDKSNIIHFRFNNLLFDSYIFFNLNFLDFVLSPTIQDW